MIETNDEPNKKWRDDISEELKEHFEKEEKENSPTPPTVKEFMWFTLYMAIGTFTPSILLVLLLQPETYWQRVGTFVLMGVVSVVSFIFSLGFLLLLGFLHTEEKAKEKETNGEPPVTSE